MCFKSASMPLRSRLCASRPPNEISSARRKKPSIFFMSEESIPTEEAISRASTLYLSIGSKNASVMYSENRRNGGKFYLEYLLFSPYVFFFRNSNHDFLPHPVLTSVLSSPAPNKRRFALSGPELEKVLEKRIFRILAVAAEEKKKDLILGAWGCGVFGNDPVAVASIFKKVIHESFANAFRNIIFAIPEGRYDNNYESFREVFS